MKTKLICVLLGLMLFTGCLRTLHPLYTDDTVVFDPALVGAWSDSDTTWEFHRAKGRGYRLFYQEDEQRGEFSAHLVRIDGALFLDLCPAKPPLAMTDFYEHHLLRVHTFLHVEVAERELRLRTMDPDWFSSWLDENPEALAFEDVGNGGVITASTEELREFVSKHLLDDEAWCETSAFDRVEAPERATLR